MPAFAELVLHVAAPGHPGTLWRPSGRLPQARLDLRDARRGRLAAVGARGQVADVGAAEPDHPGARRCRRLDLVGGADGGDPVIPDQHGAGRAGARGHGDNDGILKDQLYRSALRYGCIWWPSTGATWRRGSYEKSPPPPKSPPPKSPPPKSPPPLIPPPKAPPPQAPPAPPPQ